MPEEEKKYPEPTMFGTTPAHGFFVRHVRGLEMDGINIEHTNQDGCPVFVLDDVVRRRPGQNQSGFGCGSSGFFSESGS